MKPVGPVFDKLWRDTSYVVPVARNEVDAMVRRHYLGKWPGVCVLALGLKRPLGMEGVIIFVMPPRETAKRYGGVTWELARLWLEDWIPQNGETFLIARAVRYIRQHHPEVKVLVSYADPSVGHAGTIYKAANWVADGRTDEERKTPRFDYADAITGKRYSRKGHVPEGTVIQRIPRVSKWRFIYRLSK